MKQTKGKNGVDKRRNRLPVRRGQHGQPIPVRIPPELCGTVEDLAIANRCSYQQQAEILLREGIEAVKRASR